MKLVSLLPGPKGALCCSDQGAGTEHEMCGDTLCCQRCQGRGQHCAAVFAQEEGKTSERPASAPRRRDLPQPPGACIVDQAGTMAVSTRTVGEESIPCRPCPGLDRGWHPATSAQQWEKLAPLEEQPRSFFYHLAHQLGEQLFCTSSWRA